MTIIYQNNTRLFSVYVLKKTYMICEKEAVVNEIYRRVLASQ